MVFEDASLISGTSEISRSGVFELGLMSIFNGPL